MSGIYIHIPVCACKCHYCDFYSVASPALLERLIPSYHQQIRYHRDFFPVNSEPVQTLYFGGGTPSLCSPADLRDLIQSCENTFPVQWEEITLEANPDDLTPLYLESLLKAGINRLSIGVQSFQDSRLKQLNRRHSARQSLIAIREAQKAGFRNISVDWIYGLPEYSNAEWESDLNQFLSLEVQHISAYHLSIEENTLLYKWVQKGLFTEISEEESELQYLRLIDALGKAGYDHYEISNFSLPGFASRHNSAYWEGNPYLGIGPGAHGFDGTYRYANLHNIHSYLRIMASENKDHLLERELLDFSDALNEFLMTSLRTRRGIDALVLKQKFGEAAFNSFLKTAASVADKKNICNEGMQFYIPQEKWLISNTIIKDFIQ